MGEDEVEEELLFGACSSQTVLRPAPRTVLDESTAPLELTQEIPRAVNSHSEQLAALRVVDARMLTHIGEDALLVRSRVLCSTGCDLWGFGAGARGAGRKSEVEMVRIDLVSAAFN